MNQLKTATTAPLCNLLLGLLIIVQAPIMFGIVSGPAVIGVMPWVLAAYPAIIVSVVFMIINGQLLDATVNGLLSIVLMGQNFVKGIIWLPFTAQGTAPGPDLLAAMNYIDGLGFLLGGVVLLFVGSIHFKANKIAGASIWCCAAGFICLFIGFYAGIGLLCLVGGAGMMVLAIFLVYAGISEVVARVKTAQTA